MLQIIFDFCDQASKEIKNTVRVILGQNCVRLSDAALDDLFFSKICFIKSSVNNMLLT